jgi:F-type H+-transporting ATPase subunit epsilon
MATSFSLTIVTPSHAKLDNTDVEIVVAPGAAGDLAALANHAPMLTSLRPGVIRATVAANVRESQAQRLEFAVNGGFMQILPDKVTILTDDALAASEIDVKAAEADLSRAQREAAEKSGDERALARDVAWANARLEVARESRIV